MVTTQLLVILITVSVMVLLAVMAAVAFVPYAMKSNAY